MKNIGSLVVSVILLAFAMATAPNNPIIIYIFTAFVIVSLAGFFERQIPLIQQIVCPLIFVFGLGYLMPIIGFHNLFASIMTGAFFLILLSTAICNIVVTLNEKGLLKREAPLNEIVAPTPTSIGNATKWRSLLSKFRR